MTEEILTQNTENEENVGSVLEVRRNKLFELQKSNNLYGSKI